MANIKQQKKRIRRAAAERLENLRYKSTIRTLFRRIEEGGSEDLDAEARSLERLIDRAAARGAIHRNNAARKKARLARTRARQTAGTGA